jgi:hypothetical protein
LAGTAVRATHRGERSLLAEAIGRDLKGKASPILYGIAIAMAFVQPWVAYCIYILVALMWFIPDRRIERAVDERVAAGEAHDPVEEARATAEEETREED